MKLVTILLNDQEAAGIETPAGIICVDTVNRLVGTAYKTSIWELIQEQEIPKLTAWYNNEGKNLLETMESIPYEQCRFAPIYRNPKRIFGIGVNYSEHIISEPTSFPVSFFKNADTLIGPGENIELPKFQDATKTSAEAELAIIIGKNCQNIAEEDWQSVIAGYTTALDMTEESILFGTENRPGDPRYLAISKNFPTFFSVGCELVTPDEVPDVFQLEVQSVLNDKPCAVNNVSHMIHSPGRIISLHSNIQGWYAGDIISTGTPGAFVLKDGDIAECRITGPDGFEMMPLANPVLDLKKPNHR